MDGTIPRSKSGLSNHLRPQNNYALQNNHSTIFEQLQNANMNTKPPSITSRSNFDLNNSRLSLINPSPVGYKQESGLAKIKPGLSMTKNNESLKNLSLSQNERDSANFKGGMKLISPQNVTANK